MSLHGRVVLVTGAGQGIGEACALAFGRLGARVVLTGRDAHKIEQVAHMLRETGAKAVAFPCDVTHADQVQHLVQQAELAFGPIEILVANAGISASAPFSKTDDALWNRVITTNLTGTFYCMRAVLDGMVARGYGRIIAVASDAGKVGYQYTAAYCASKHGVVGLVRALATEVARKGITVNAICPGFVDTPMTDASVSTIASKSKLNEGQAKAYLENLNPQGRLVSPEEVAAMAVYLAGDAARGVHGQSIPLDGGAVQS